MTVPKLGTNLDGKCGGPKRSGGVCTQAAGWGTDHPGVGRCKLHGGCNPAKHGMYSTVFGGPFGEAVKRHLQDPNPLDLTPELALLRAHLDSIGEKYAKLDMMPTERDVEALRKTVDSVQRLADTLSKIRTREALTTHELTYILTVLTDIMRDKITDPGLLREILTEMQRRIVIRATPLLEGGE